MILKGYSVLRYRSRSGKERLTKDTRSESLEHVLLHSHLGRAPDAEGQARGLRAISAELGGVADAGPSSGGRRRLPAERAHWGSGIGDAEERPHAVALAARDWEHRPGFQIVFWVKVVLVLGLVAASYVHNFVLGPRLQREIREGREPLTRPRLVVVGWTSYGLTLAIPILGVVLQQLVN